MLGLFAGGIRHFRPHWVATVKGVFWVATIGTALHRLTPLILVNPFNDALALSWEVFLPVAILNTLGSVDVSPIG
jgi:5TMR of 5TMR-LYT